MVLHAGLGPRHDCFQKPGEPCRAVRRAAFFARDAAQGKIQTREMRPRLLPRPQHGRNQQRAEPGLPVEWRVAVPGVPQEGRRQEGEIGLDLRGGAPPRLEFFVLFRVRIIDLVLHDARMDVHAPTHALTRAQMIAEKRRPGRPAREDFCAAIQRAIDRRQFAGEQAAIAGRSRRFVILRTVPSPARTASLVPPSPSPRKALRPSGLRAQSGAAPAIRRRARSTMRLTRSPASQRQAQASWKWVRLTKPSAIGLDLMRSSSFASASSAAVSAPKAAPGRDQSKPLLGGLKGVTRAARRRRSQRLGRGPA